MQQQSLATQQNKNRLDPSNWSIRGKIMGAILLVIILLAFLLTAYNYTSLSRDTVKIKGEEYLAYGEQTMEKAAELINGSVKALRTLALSPDIIQAASTTNVKYIGRDQQDIDTEIARLDKAWKDNDPSIEDLVKSIADNDLSGRLREFIKTFPEEVEVFITDIQGLNIAMTDRTSDYLQADEEWWQSTFKGGAGEVYVSEVDHDESTGVYAIDIGVPIRDRTDNKVVGILRGTVNVSLVFDGLSKVAFGKTGYASLLDKQGKILYTRDSSLLMKNIPEQFLEILKRGKDDWNANIKSLDGSASVVAYTGMKGSLASYLGWTIFITQDLDEVTEPVRNSLISSLVVAFLAALVLSGIGLWISNSISKPIGLITSGAQFLSVGDVEMSGMDWVGLNKLTTRQDELGQVGSAFLRLVNYLKEMTSAAQKIAANDLTTQVKPKSQTDLLGNAFSQMVINLSKSVGQVADNARVLSDASHQLATAADQAGRATNQIAATVQEVARGVGQ